MDREPEKRERCLMPRRMILGVFVFGLVLATGSSVALAAPTAGGGGHACPEPQSDLHTTQVDVKEGCMLPTVVRIDAGATITWTNRDEALHTVTGTDVRSGRPGAGSWGSIEELAQNQTFSHTFNDAGVYPYYCMLHPGMIGAVVVGNGVPEHPYTAGTGAAAASDSGGASSHTQTQTQQRSSTSGSNGIDGTFIIVVAAFGVAIGAGVAYTYRRLRGDASTAAATK